MAQGEIQMQFVRQLLTFCAVIGTLAAATPVLAAADAPKPATGAAKKLAGDPNAKDLILKGDAKCTGCHDEADEPTGVATMLELNPQVLSIGKTKHGTTADKRTPTCVDCHGESEKHVQHKGSDKPPKVDKSFRKNSPTPANLRSETCLTCHEKDSKRHLWSGSAHDSRDVACNGCHQVHAKKDKVRDKRTQAEVCFTCHKEQRAQVNKQSHHPILEGKVACSDCHNSHGSAGPKLMKRDSVVETCYTCHMEKRGPFVHNHQPVNDDCGNCHMPHGTSADNLLKARAPMVCYQCHSGHGTPGVAGVAPGVTTSAKANTFIEQGRGCLNCHTEIHGSNNPNGGSNLLPPAFFLR
jgi:DmsE family decaheme c-type cytochrome